MASWKRLFHLGGVDDVVDWEIKHHLEERADELQLEHGLDRRAALREARRAFGDLEGVRDAMRSESRGRMRRLQVMAGLRGLGQDVRLAARRLRMRPGFALVAILVLGLGIGANAAVFSVLEAALLQRPPYPEPDRLVMIDLVSPTGEGGGPIPWSYPKFDHVRAALRTVDSVAGYSPSMLTLTGAGDARRLGIEYVSPAYFPLLGIDALRGRVFGSGEERIGEAGVVLLGESLWRGSFGADPGIIGRTVTLDGAALEVIGVVPSRFRGLSGSADAWVPFAGIATIRGARRLQLPSAHWLYAVGRLRPGATLEHARADASQAAAALREAFPPRGDWDPREIGLEPLASARVNPVTRLAVAAVSLGAGLLLLIACANISALLLVRASARRGELALRGALGASRWRLIRESLVESLMLALAGAVLGLALAWAGQRAIGVAVGRALDTSGSRSLQFLDPAALSIDGSVILAGVAAAVVMGLAFGLVPGIAAARSRLTGALMGVGRSAVRERSTRIGLVRTALVGGQLALTLVLLSGAALMAASFARLSGLQPGFAERNVLALRLDRGARHGEASMRAFEQAMLERVAALPGVRSVAVGPCPPLTSPCEIVAVQGIDGAELPRGTEDAQAIAYAISDDYFRTLGIAMKAGRSFAPEDGPSALPAIVISERAAQRWFPGGSALGRRMTISHELTEAQPAVIIGVVADVQYDALEAPIVPTVYLSRHQAPASYGTLFVGTSGDPLHLLDAVRREVSALDRDAPLYGATTLAAIERAATGRTRVVLLLLATFAALGLLLSATGLYGIVSYAVLARAREMGVRIALGASAREVLRLVLRAPLLVAAAGAAAGMLAAMGLTRYVRELLFGVSATDPRVLGAAALALMLVALAAAAVPARRVLRVDPASALRSE